MTQRIHIRRETLADGRSLSLYGWRKHDEVRTDHLIEPPPLLPQINSGLLSWHPLLQEYVTVSPHRQNRTFKPAADRCPLCPTQISGHSTEIPFANFELAVFDNRFPSFVLPEQAIPLDDPTLHLANGKCEVVVYSPDHTQTMGTMSDAQRLLLIETWVHRYDTLLGLPNIAYTHMTESRGEAMGVTLFHPHGQIYAMPFVPPIQTKMAAAFQQDPRVLANVIAKNPGSIISEQDSIVAFCPDFGLFSYEVWLAPRDPKAGLWNFDRTEREAFAVLMGKTARAYDALFNQPMPYLMAMHSAPLPFEKNWHAHMTFQPFLRAADKLKYLAAIEVTSGHYLKDVTAQQAVSILKPLFDQQD